VQPANDFPRGCRLLLKRDFQRLFSHGVKTSDRDFAMWHLRAEGAGQRLGVIVSKKALGCAVKRNRARRLIREVFRLHRRLIADGCEMIMCPRSDRNLGACGDMEKAVLRIWKKAGIYAG